MFFHGPVELTENDKIVVTDDRLCPINHSKEVRVFALTKNYLESKYGRQLMIMLRPVPLYVLLIFIL